MTRYRLLLMSKEYPNRFNVSLSGIYAETPYWIRSELEPFVTGRGNNFKDSAKHKFSLDIEGNSFSDRLRDLLALDSVLLKQEYPFIDFIGMAAQPWIHYVPIKQDLSDLIPKLDVLIGESLDSELYEWTRIKIKWAQQYLFASDDLPVLYTYYLLKRYHASQDFTVQLPPGSTPITIKR